MILDSRADLLEEARTHSPFSYFDLLRARAPLHWNERHRAWLVTNYADVADGFRDTRLLSNRIRRLRDKLRPEQQPTIGRALSLLETWMVFQDPPEHKRLRGVVHKAFTPQVVKHLEQDVRDLARAQVARLNQRLTAAPEQPVDILNEIAYKISGPIICKMLGVPAEDSAEFIARTEEIASVIGGFAADPDRNERTYQAVVALEAYLSKIIDNTDSSAMNLLAQLIAAEADGERLTREEVIASGILILFGGNRTTSCMIANGVRALLLHPDQLEALRSDPGKVNAAVEEILRWESHTKHTIRVVGEDFEWNGETLRKGQLVFLSPLAANRDPAMF